MSVEIFRPRALVAISALVGGTREVVTGTDGRPRVEARGGETITSTLIPLEATWTVQPHNRAGTCEVTLPTAAAMPFDYPSVHSVLIQLYAGLGGSGADILRDETFRQRKNLRFLGYVDAPRVTHGKQGTAVAFSARDLSSLARDAPMPTAATPRYTDTVNGAVQRIMDLVPGMSDSLKLASEVPEASLAKLVGKKGRSGPVQLRHGISAWEAIEAVCGMAALLPSVFLDELIIRRPGSVYGKPGDTDGSATDFTFVWGARAANVEELVFEKKFIRNRRGVILYGYDPENDQVLVSKYPADDKLPPRLRVGASHPGRNPPKSSDGIARGAFNTRQPPKHPRKPQAGPQQPPERVPIYVRDIHTQDGLDAAAERAWIEMAAQESEGEIRTPIWSEELLALGNGARVDIKVRPDLESEIRSFALSGDKAAALGFLKQRLGVDDEAARALVELVTRERFDRYLASRLTHAFRAGASPSTSVQFINLLRF